MRAVTQRPGMTTFALFGEMLLVGVVVTVASVPGVTALPALAAGVNHLRRHVADDAGGVGRAVADARAAWRDLWPAALLLPVVLGLLLLNLTLALAQAVPGAGAVGLLSGVLAVVTVVVAVRVAAGWRPGAPWRDLVRWAGAEAFRDPHGSVIVLVAVAGGLVLAWAVPALTLVVTGLVALAALAVSSRSAPDPGR